MPRITKKSQLQRLVVERGWSRIGEGEWGEIRAVVPGISPEDLQALQVPVIAPWYGVRQHSLDELAESLCALSEVYGARGDLRKFCRSTVIRAKERARWASRNAKVDEARRRIKAEMVEWMLIWLGDPALFPAWAELRRSRGFTAPAAR